MKPTFKIDPASITRWPKSEFLEDGSRGSIADSTDIHALSIHLRMVERTLMIVNLQFDSVYECWDFDLCYARKNASWEGVLGWRIPRRSLPAIPLDLHIYEGESYRLCGFPSHTSF